MRFGLLYLCCFFLMCVSLSASNPEELYLNETIEQRDFDEAKWKETISGIDYASDRKKEKKKQENTSERDPQQRNPGRTRPQVSFGDGTATAILKFFIILSGVVILVLILRSLLGLGVNPRNKKINKGENDTGIQIEQIEENIYESDLDHYIRQALDNQDFNLAIRLYYLAVLKELSLQKRIKWKKDKTNRAYLFEMSTAEDFNAFSNITQIFERIWYGNLQLAQKDFIQIEPLFKEYLQSISFQTT